MSLVSTTPNTTPMKRELIHKLHATLEKLVHKETATGTEFWLARDLQKVLGYVRWGNFEKVIHKAVMSCELAGYPSDDHFLPVDKIDDLGEKKTRKVRDFALTRYACYLIAQNADSSKDPVAFAQTYFAVQTRRQEIIETRLRDQERVDARRKLSQSEKVLSGLIYEHVENEQGFRRIRTKGDQALFGGVTTRQMKRRLKVPKGLCAGRLLAHDHDQGQGFCQRDHQFQHQARLLAHRGPDHARAYQEQPRDPQAAR